MTPYEGKDIHSNSARADVVDPESVSAQHGLVRRRCADAVRVDHIGGIAAMGLSQTCVAASLNTQPP
jgi:hypothetical protein